MKRMSLLDNKFDIDLSESIKHKVVNYLKLDYAIPHYNKNKSTYEIIYIGIDDIDDLNSYGFSFTYNDKEKVILVTFKKYDRFEKGVWWAMKPMSFDVMSIQYLLENF